MVVIEQLLILMDGGKVDTELVGDVDMKSFNAELFNEKPPVFAMAAFFEMEL